MNGNSKRERVEQLIRRAVREAVAELAIQNPESAQWLKSNRGFLEADTQRRITWDAYRMKELQDIMDWKKPKSE